MPDADATFRERISELPSETELTLSLARSLVSGLIQQLDERIVGQKEMNQRVVTAVLCNSHVLLEGQPGDGKTTCVKELASCVGYRFRRLTFRPDMLPGDLIGMRTFVPPKNGAAGEFQLEFCEGPVFTAVFVADEINRAPAKVQSALLECMSERTVSRPEDPSSSPVIHKQDRNKLVNVRNGTMCFGVPVDRLLDPNYTPFLVCATQNPFELEGTYPLPEAQLDRFMFFVKVTPVDRRHFADIVSKSLPPPLSEPTRLRDDNYEWIKTGCFFTWLREELFAKKTSVLRSWPEQKPGLWDRLFLILMLSHWRYEEFDGALALVETSLPSALGDPHREQIALQIRQDLIDPAVRSNAVDFLSDPMFEFVHAGCTNRGLIDWSKASVAAAFLEHKDSDGEFDLEHLKRRHVRSVAADVLRHRIRLTAQARAEQFDTPQLIERLIETFLPDLPNHDQENRADQTPLFRRPALPSTS